MTPRDREKLRNGWEVVSEQGNMTRLAERLGVTTPLISVWSRQFPDLRKALLDGIHKGSLSPEATERRARLCAHVRLYQTTWASVGRQEGVSTAAIVNWAKRHEDEILEAMEDLRSERRAA